MGKTNNPSRDRRRLENIQSNLPWIRCALQKQPHPDLTPEAAMELLLAQYQVAIRSYLLGALQDLDAADEVYQDFAVKLVRGDFQNVDPARGRFRDLIKTALINL